MKVCGPSWFVHINQPEQHSSEAHMYNFNYQ